MNEVTEELKDKLDPYIANIASQIGTSIESIIAPEVVETQSDGMVMIPEPVGAARPPGYKQAMGIEPSKEEPKEEAAKPEVKVEAKVEPKVEAAVETRTEKPQTIVKLVKKDADPVQTEEEKKAEAKINEQEDYIKTLTPEQQEEIEIARFAEKSGKTGLVDGLIGYYKKAVEFAEENPDKTADDDEFVKLRETARPKWSDVEKRKAEREMIASEAAARARAETLKEIEPQAAALRQIRSKPAIEKSVQEAKAILESEDDGFDKGLVEKIASGDFKSASEENPVEASIVSGTLNAVRAWNEIVNGVEKINEKNETHSWILNFINSQTRAMLASPKEVQVVNGRQFVPITEFERIRTQEPEKLASVWTLDNAMISERIAKNGISVLKSENERLRKAGWERKPKQVQAKSNTEADKSKADEDSIRSPKAGSAPGPGAGETSANNDVMKQTLPHLSFVMKAMKT